MGKGPQGSGVEIVSPEDSRFAGMSQPERQLILRRERAQRMKAHREAENAYAEHGEDAFKMSDPPENKIAEPPPNKSVADTLGELSKAELVELAERRGVTVTRADGRDDLKPTATDYRRALAE